MLPPPPPLLENSFPPCAGVIISYGNLSLDVAANSSSFFFLFLAADDGN